MALARRLQAAPRVHGTARAQALARRGAARARPRARRGAARRRGRRRDADGAAGRARTSRRPSALRELGANLEALAALPRGDGGSNHWVLAGSRTASGKPLLAGDPHRSLDLPNVYWQNHLRCARFDAIGLSFAGVPGFPHFGHNAHVAWSVTHAMADDQDLFVERLGPDELARAERRSETVSVRGARAGRDRDRRDRGTARSCSAGPSAGVGIALAWTVARRRRLDLRRGRRDARRAQHAPSSTRRCATGSCPATTS